MAKENFMISWKSLKHQICAALLLGAVSMQAATAAPVLSLTASSNPATVGSTVNINVAIADVSDLYAYQFSLLFDPTRFLASSAAEGAFLATGGNTFFDGGTIDNASGSISYAFNTLLSAVPGVTGSGSLASFSFDVIGSGDGAFSLADVMFLDSNLNEISVQAGAVTVAAVPEPSAYWLLAIGLGAVAVARRRAAV
jgi:hypothetical protein